MSTASTESQALETLVERFGLKTFVEACLVLEEGVAGIKDIDIGMMAGAGILPGPFARADAQGLDEILAALERAESEWGENFAPPLILRRLVGQGRLGQKSGQGFFPYPQPDGDSSYETIARETRDDITILWLNRPPANPLSPQVIRELADLVGLDVTLHTAEHIAESYGDRFYVSKRLKELVEAGDLGQKTGKGFYEHGEG